MEIKGKNILVLGGSGEVGTAICKQLLRYQPAKIVIASNDGQAENTAKMLANDSCACTCQFDYFTGNIFVRWGLKDTHAPYCANDVCTIVEDVFDELSDEILNESTLYRLTVQTKPDIIVDCINTATALAYKNIYDAYKNNQEWHHLLLTVIEPALIRHIQILYRAMQASKTQLYLKIGTTGTGGMGFNIPFTHGEENPSRLLMGKALAAGGQTSLLYLMSQTPGAPITKELKPATMIGWKNIGKGTIKKSGNTYPLYGCNPGDTYTLKDGNEFNYNSIEKQGYMADGSLSGTYIDTGENGYFTSFEFEIVTAQGLMEYITPDDIAHQAVAEITGTNTSCNVLSAIDGAVMKSTYRAGLLRNDAIKAANEINSGGVAYGFLGPRQTKYIFECKLICDRYKYVRDFIDNVPADIAQNLVEIIAEDGEIRTNCLSIGMPILYPDGKRLLFAKRSNPDKTWEKNPWTINALNVDNLAKSAWIDLRPDNMRLWQQRILRTYGNDIEREINVAQVVSWILINECEGGRLGACQ